MATENGQDAQEAYLTYLRGEIERLTALMRAVESGGQGLPLDPAAAAAIGGGRPNNVVRPDSFFNMTTPQATRKYLEMMGKGNPQTPTAIVEALTRGGLYKPEQAAVALKNVYTALKRGKDREFTKIHKEWGLSEWYGDRKAPASQPAKKKRKKKGHRAPRQETAAPAAHESNAPTKRNPFAVYNEFVKQQMAAGRSKAEADAAWRKQQG